MPDTGSHTLIPCLLVALVGVGMALAFVSADRHSPTSRALGLFVAALGVSIALYALHYDARGHGHLPGWVALPETVAVIAVLEWLLRVRRTVDARGLRTAFGDGVLRLAQAMAVLYGGLALGWPEQRLHEFLGATTHPGSFRRLGFWMFAAPGVVVMLAVGTSSLLLLNRRLDPAERVRLWAMNAAVPVLFGSFLVRWELVPLVLGVGEMIILVGAVHYHVMQGARGQFLGRFLAPEVAALVQARGVGQVMARSSLEISVVCCDLRGFTAFARAQPPERVIEVLREYYDAVGARVSACGGTIKDFAGDGILILVGAPLEQADHAPRALALAREVRDLGVALTASWSRPESRLGLGIGVATGVVTVGIIDSVHRLEYTAVGSAVNLAARLCAETAAGEIRVDARTLALAGEQVGTAQAGPGPGTEAPGWREGVDEPVWLKGFDAPVPSWRLAAPGAADAAAPRVTG